VTREQAKAGAEKLFAAMDLNQDGKLDAADREVRLGRMFDRIDADHDGKISRAEFITAHRDGAERREDTPGPEGIMRARALGMGAEILREADPQHTGTVSHDAFVAAALTLFDRADANHDGKVAPEERRAAMAGRMGGPGGHRMGGMDMHGDDMTPPAGE
jgi:Ca2+-binding EF-hand superfamily protein